MIGLRFTRQAESDIVAIHDYTQEIFGPLQWDSYEEGLRTAFTNLRSNPLLGADRSAVKANVRRLLFRSHVLSSRS
jgi:plasmid stabilization system protein ParE